MKSGSPEASAEHSEMDQETLERLRQLGIQNPKEFLDRLDAYTSVIPAGELVSKVFQLEDRYLELKERAEKLLK